MNSLQVNGIKTQRNFPQFRQTGAHKLAMLNWKLIDQKIHKLISGKTEKKFEKRRRHMEMIQKFKYCMPHD